MRFVSLGIVALLLAALVARSSWSDSNAGAGPSLSPDDTTEPITGVEAVPNPGNEDPARDPFTLNDPGGSAHDVVTYAQMAPAEKLAADQIGQNAEASHPPQVQDAFAAASAERAHLAAATAAGNQINAGNLAIEGVVLP